MQELNEVEWEWLKPHYQRDAIILVDPSLALQSVGKEISQNNAAQVQSWIELGLLKKPSSVQMAAWEQSPELRFQAIIVQPFVLVQFLQS